LILIVYAISFRFIFAEFAHILSLFHVVIGYVPRIHSKMLRAQSRCEEFKRNCKASPPDQVSFIEVGPTCVYFRRRPLFHFVCHSNCFAKLESRFLLGQLKLLVEVLRLLDIEGFAVELIEPGKHGRAAPEAGVTVFFNG
jgi:hypothetical protein